MDLSMNRAEREAFLADVHVGVIGVAHGGAGPLVVPVWYSYRSGGTVDVITGPSSLKARMVEVAGRFSLCAQTETAPYKYVSVEGPVTSVDTVDADERRAMARRYLGTEFGDAYIEATEAESSADVVLRMSPEHWRTIDYTKQFG
jgi:nitroimidazol reductase NimA-like FMN-containing flavoprotein (pyridoxamine 5'-phosphate oxidase superfamily)